MSLFFWKKILPENKVPESEPVSLNIETVSLADFKRMIKYGKPSDTIGKYKSKAFIHLPYGVIKKDLPVLQKRDNQLETVKLILECQFENVDLSNVSGNDILSFLIWIKQQQEFIINLEKNHLHSDPEDEMKAAGIYRLNEFGGKFTISQLAQKYSTIPKEIEKWPYYEVYEDLKMDKVHTEIQKAYNKIMEEKLRIKNKS